MVFSEALLPAEVALVKCASLGQECDLTDQADNEVRGEMLSALLGGEGPRDETGSTCWPIHHTGLRLRGARVSGVVNLRNVQLSVPLCLHCCEVDGRLSLEDASTKTLELSGCVMSGGLDADGIKVDGSVSLDRGFASPTYQVRIIAGHISRNLYCLGASFTGTTDRDGHPTRVAFVADGTVIAGRLDWRQQPREGDRPPIPITTGGAVRLLGMSVGALTDEIDQWPDRVHLRGLVYGQIMGELKELNVADRIAWVRKGHTNHRSSREQIASWWQRFRGHEDAAYVPTQPYVQLAAFYRARGRDVDSRRVLRARWFDELKAGPSRPANIPIWIWRWVLHVTVGSGYQPARVLAWLVLLFALGLGVTHAAIDRGVLVTTAPTSTEPLPVADRCAPEYDCLDPVAYVLDVLTPFDVGEQADWRVDDTAPAGWRTAYWLGVILGWALSIIFVASFTPAVRKE